ncbi:hypothetical protein BHM03_00054658 [Ensete ventricosum]|nr:hypothetical protein BHM03_00054658 [Ensete ventricosum]
MFHLSSQAVLPKGDRRRLIEGKIDHRQSISAIGGRFRRNREGKKKKSKRRKKRKRKGTSSRPRPRAVATRGSPASRYRHRRPRAIFLPAQREKIEPTMYWSATKPTRGTHTIRRYQVFSPILSIRGLYTYDGVSVTIPRRPKLGAMEHCNFLFGMGRIRP